MIETEYKEVTRTNFEDVAIKAVCDGCGKEEKTLPDDWYEFTGHHHEWGNDSIDSIEKFHCCSAKCYIPALSKAAERFKNYEDSAEIDEKSLPFILGLIKTKAGL